MLHLLPKVTFSFTELTINLMEDQHKQTPFLQGFLELRVLHAQCYSSHIRLQTEIPLLITNTNTEGKGRHFLS